MSAQAQGAQASAKGQRQRCRSRWDRLSVEPLGNNSLEPFLSIGGYANAIGANVNYRLGKIAFHDHHLTATERLALWNAMVNP